MISVDDLLLFCHRTLDGYDRALDRLDRGALEQGRAEDPVNTAPWAGAMTPFQLVVHGVGATRWWVMHHAAGRAVSRDRDSEFAARGSLAEARAALADFRRELDDARDDLVSTTQVHGAPTTQTPLGVPWTVGACLVHAYEELAQHLGHLEMTVDLLAPAT